jgi:hypothetical protein
MRNTNRPLTFTAQRTKNALRVLIAALALTATAACAGMGASGAGRDARQVAEAYSASGTTDDGSKQASRAQALERTNSVQEMRHANVYIRPHGPRGE